jgi:hypothetical protein
MVFDKKSATAYNKPFQPTRFHSQLLFVLGGVDNFERRKFMKKILSMVSVLTFLAMIAGCATFMPLGSVYTELKLPLAATANGGQVSKVGTATCTSVLTLVALGDCSIDTAKKNGGITKVYHVDWDAYNILGIYGKYKLTAYGE